MRGLALHGAAGRATGHFCPAGACGSISAQHPAHGPSAAPEGPAGRVSPSDGRSGGPWPVCDSARVTEQPGAVAACCVLRRAIIRALARMGGSRGHMWVPLASHMWGRIGIRHCWICDATLLFLRQIPAASHLMLYLSVSAAWLLPPIWGQAPSPPENRHQIDDKWLIM